MSKLIKNRSLPGSWSLKIPPYPLPATFYLLIIRRSLWLQVSWKLTKAPSTRIRIFFESTTFSFRIQKFSRPFVAHIFEFASEFAGCVRNEAVSGKKQLQIQNYPGTYGPGLTISLDIDNANQEFHALQLNMVNVLVIFWCVIFLQLASCYAIIGGIYLSAYRVSRGLLGGIE